LGKKRKIAINKINYDNLLDKKEEVAINKIN
jgi:hypothetical protein